MLALNKSDIEDIASGNHNRYVESQDKDELLRELAERLLKASPDISKIDDNLDNISNCLDDIEEKLEDAENISDNVYEFCIRKLDEADKYINEAKDVLLTIDQ